MLIYLSDEVLKSFLLLVRFYTKDVLIVLYSVLLFITLFHPPKKNALYLTVNVFSTKVLTGDTIFYVYYWRQDRHVTWSSEPREGLASCSSCSAKGLPSFLSYFKTLSVGPAPESNPRPLALKPHALRTELTLPRLGSRRRQ